MEDRRFKVPKINCGHCTATIERELSALEGVKSVAADALTKDVAVQFDEPASWQGIEALLKEIGFPPAA